MSNLALMQKVNYSLVAKNLNLPIQPTYFSWNSIVNSLNRIKLPKNHIIKNACSSQINCKYPPGSLNSGVPRVLMPEVNRSVLENLKGKIDFTEHTMSVQELADSYVAQREILLPKIEAQAEAIKAGKFDIFGNTWYIATASDGKKVIIDGHHGWGALNLLLKEGGIDPTAQVNVVDFNESPEKVISMAFYEGDAHTNPFRPNLVKTGGKKHTKRNRNNKRKSMKGGCMPEAFRSTPWSPNGPYAKPKPDELIRKLNTGLTSYFWRDAGALANTISAGPLTDIEVCLQKMKAEIADLQARVPPAANENNNANENPS